MCLASTLRAPRAPDWLVHLAPSINFTHIEEVTHRPGTNKRAAANPLAHTRRAAPPPGLVPAARTDARDAYVVVPVAKASPPEELQPEPRRPRSRHPRSRRTCGSQTARHFSSIATDARRRRWRWFERACAHPSRAGRFSPSQEEPPHLRVAAGHTAQHQQQASPRTPGGDALAGSSGQRRTRRGRVFCWRSAHTPGRGAALRAAHAALLRTTGKAA